MRSSVRKIRLFAIVAGVLLGTLGMVACNNQTQTQSDLAQLVAAEDSVAQVAQSALDEGANLFSDLLAQSGVTQQASQGIPRPYTLVDQGQSKILIGGPYRPPFPFPIPNGAQDLDGKPLFLTIKFPSPRPASYASARLGVLRRTPQGYEVEWHGARGMSSIRTPATVEEWVNQEVGQGEEKIIVKFSKEKIERPDGTVETKVDLIIIVGKNNTPYRIIHVITPLPEEGEGLDTQQAFSSETLTAKIREVCCGRPKPFPPLNPPWPILLREDFVAGFVPYNNPIIQQATSPEDLLDQDLGILYARKRPVPLPPTTTDCGPNRVWCPPDRDPLMNVRLVREQGTPGSYAIQLRRLGENAPFATLPVTVSTAGRGAEASIDITDQYDPATKKIKIIVTITTREFIIIVTIEI